MLKKTFLVLLFLLVMSLTFASNFTVNYVSTDSLFKPFVADSWSATTRAQYINLMKTDGIYQTLAFTKFEEERESEYYKYDAIKPDQREDFLYEVVSFRDKADAIKQLYRVKTGFSVSALRINYKDIASLEFNVQGALNLVFDAKHGTDCLGFDGIYFYGVNASFLNDLITLRVGKHHYSGHYGDEIDEALMLRSDNLERKYADRFSYKRTEDGYISKLIQYVRQDSLVIGASVQPNSWLRIYSEFDCIPKKIFRYRPWILDPENVYCTEDIIHGETLEQVIGQSEGAYATTYESRVKPYSSKYKGLSIEAGIELTLPIKNIMDIQLAFDTKLFQEALTGYQVGAFDENNKWDVDYNVMLAIAVNNTPLQAEVIYHHGRFPLMNLFWQQCDYWSVGFSINY